MRSLETRSSVWGWWKKSNLYWIYSEGTVVGNEELKFEDDNTHVARFPSSGLCSNELWTIKSKLQENLAICLKPGSSAMVSITLRKKTYESIYESFLKLTFTLFKDRFVFVIWGICWVMLNFFCISSGVPKKIRGRWSCMTMIRPRNAGNCSLGIWYVKNITNLVILVRHMVWRKNMLCTIQVRSKLQPLGAHVKSSVC